MKPPGFVPSPFFACRTPLLPFEDFEVWTAGAKAPAAMGEPAAFTAALEDDRWSQRLRLQELVRRPVVREAIFLASPELEQALDAWFRDPESDMGRRAERAIVKYVSRMTARATPFGLFAGNSVGANGARTRLVVEPQGSCRRHSRLDMNYLVALGEALGRDPTIRKGLMFRPSSTLYVIGDRLRYVEADARREARTYHLVSIEDSAALRTVLEQAASGATLEALAASLVSEEISREEADAFIGELAAGQILVPSLGLTITGPEPTAAMVSGLLDAPATSEVATRLDGVARELAAIDASPLGIEPARYRSLAASLSGLPVEPELSRLFQVDLVKVSPGATLGPKVHEEIHRSIDLLRRTMLPRSSNLTPFRDAFEERYGEQEIPLLEALDEESGIGYPAFEEEGSGTTPLLKGIPSPESSADTAHWGARERHLLKLLTRAIDAGQDEIALGEADLEAIAVRRPAPLPGAFVACVRVAAVSDDALDRGDFGVVLEWAVGPSGARFLGRFCHADPELRRLVEDHLRAEEARQPDTVFAEVVHLPEGRIGNVILRPLFREYEIPFLGESGAPAERQIPMSDLLLSVNGGELRLRSRRLGRRVIPRMTAAHNYVAFGLAPYRFLCALQEQGVADTLLWEWGALGAAPFLPRVRSGRTVLSAARWTVSRDELRRLAAAEGPERFVVASEWRRARRLPRLLRVADPGSELTFDLDSVLCVEAFVHLAKERDMLELKEMLPRSDRLFARGPDGRYVHEILIPYVTEAASPSSEPAPRAAPAARESRRSFPPGSEWLYAKLYGGGVTLDRALRETVGPLAKGLVASGVADCWFFVRYADPRTHLRVRLRGLPGRLREEALPVLAAAFEQLLDRRQIWRAQLDTYQREVERYGGLEGVEAAERLFHADSDAVLDVLRMLEPGEEGEEERWRLAVLGADLFLADLEIPVGQRQKLLSRRSVLFVEEHGGGTALKKALGMRCRDLSGEVGGILAPDGSVRAYLEPGAEAFRRRSALVEPVVARLRGLRAEGRLARSHDAIAASFLHMFLNRILVSAHRTQEMVVTELLSRHYLAVGSRREAGAEPSESDAAGS